ncbi:MAG: co-chaperone GroES [Patescibacteria group bacterium]|nr:co-chaperone GroES [Patescibacteria group bacterium]
MKLKPTSGYLLIEPLEAEKRTASGIVLPETHEEKPQRGKVLEVGDQEITEAGVKKPAPCKKGDVVVYKQWGGNEVKYEGKDYLLVKFEDILAIEVK